KPAEAQGGSLLDEIMQQTQIKPSDEGYAIARKGVEAFISELIRSRDKYEKADKKAVDHMITAIDERLSRQLDEVMHAPQFQQLESAWRGLKFVVDHTDFRENIKVEVVNVSKDDLRTDFEDAPEIMKSGLYKIVYTGEYGQHGG